MSTGYTVCPTDILLKTSLFLQFHRAAADADCGSSDHDMHGQS